MELQKIDDNKEELTGPTTSHSCRDFFFLLCFHLFVSGGVICIALAGATADPQRIIYGSDNYGNTCGKKNDIILGVARSGKDYSNKSFLLLEDVTSELSSNSFKATCVERCPPETVSQIGFRCILPVEEDDLEPNSASPETPEDQGSNSTSPEAPEDQGSNSTSSETPEDQGSNSTNPEAPEDQGSNSTRSETPEDQGSNSTSPKLPEGLMLDDIVVFLHTWREICYITLVGLALTVIIVIMMRTLPGVLLLVTLFSMVFSFFGLAIGFNIPMERMNKQLPVMRNRTDLYDMDDISHAETLKALSTAGFVISLILGFCLCSPCMGMSMWFKFLDEISKEVRKSIADMPFLLLQPLWTCFWLAIAISVYLYGNLLIDTSGVPLNQTATVIESMSAPMIVMKVYLFLCLLWVMQFIIHCQHFTVAGAVARWYFTRDKNRLGWPVLSSMKQLYLYHLGSVAFGSLMSPFRILRLIMRICQKRLTSGRSCKCYLMCFGRLLELGTNAYAEIGIYGCSLCRGSQKAFSVVIKDSYRGLHINTVGSGFLFANRIMAVIPTYFIGFAIMKGRPEVYEPLRVVVLGSLLTFLIVHCVISSLQMINDSILICFWEDQENNNGLDRLYFTSKQLKGHMEGVKRFIDVREGNCRQNKQKVKDKKQVKKKANENKKDETQKLNKDTENKADEKQTQKDAQNKPNENEQQSSNKPTQSKNNEQQRENDATESEQNEQQTQNKVCQDEQNEEQTQNKVCQDEQNEEQTQNKVCQDEQNEQQTPIEAW